MSAVEAINRFAKISPRTKARLAGLFEALEGFTSSWGQVFLLGRLVVTGNAAATAANILAHERRFWVGFAFSMLGVAFHLAWGALFYELFKIVNRSLSLVAAFVVIVCSAMQALTGFLYLAPLLILQGGSAASAFTTPQLQALAYVFLKLNNYAFEIDLIFFGLWCVLTGCLIFRSTFLPRIFGVLLAIDGVGWMTYLHPPFAAHIFPVIAAASAAAEIPLQLWLIIKGVNPERWTEQAKAGIVTDSGQKG